MNLPAQKPCARCHLRQADPRLPVIVNLISSTFRQPVSICDLARIARLDPSELSHLFKDNIGIGPKRLQAIFRVGYTLSELIDADFQIKRMAAEAGLPIVETFIRTFQRLCGLPPDEFRRLMGEIDSPMPRLPRGQPEFVFSIRKNRDCGSCHSRPILKSKTNLRVNQLLNCSHNRYSPPN
jgi:AraC-like DNA-binding protein